MEGTPKATLTLTVAQAAEIRWSDELDIAPLGSGRTASRAATYVARYATKSTEAVGGLTRPVGTAQASELPVSEHVRRFIETVHELVGHDELAHLRLDKTAHQLGFRGHWTTKSRRCSTTLTTLRQARQFHATGNAEAPAGSSWQFAGAGHASRADLVLATNLASEDARTRKIARVEITSRGK